MIFIFFVVCKSLACCSAVSHGGNVDGRGAGVQGQALGEAGMWRSEGRGCVCPNAGVVLPSPRPLWS